MKSRLFSRGLSVGMRSALEVASLEPGHWFRDLLGLWRANGTQSGTTGLRLAVRDGYLNFYRCGQSVAKVGHSGGRLQLKVHAKYVVSPEERAAASGYATLIGDKLVAPGGADPLAFLGIQSLHHWIDVIIGEYCKPDGEKVLIDGLLDCGQNDNVIDLEMALPAWRNEERVSPRMDLVTIEDVRGRLTVVFGEVKAVNDGRIRCRPGGVPEVCRQLAQYERYLEQPGHAEAISHAYSAAARDLLFLGTLAQKAENEIRLPSEIARAAHGEHLDVARDAVLVVHCGVPHSSEHWAHHRNRLLNERVRVRELDHQQPMHLGDLL